MAYSNPFYSSPSASWGPYQARQEAEQKKREAKKKNSAGAQIGQGVGTIAGYKAGEYAAGKVAEMIAGKAAEQVATQAGSQAAAQAGSQAAAQAGSQAAAQGGSQAAAQGGSAAGSGISAGTAGTIGGIAAAIAGAIRTSEEVKRMHAEKGRDISRKEFEERGSSPTVHMGIGGSGGKFLRNAENAYWKIDPLGSRVLTPVFNALVGDKTKYEGERQKALLRKLYEAGYDPNIISSFDPNDESDFGFHDEDRSQQEQLEASMKETGLPRDFVGWHNGQFYNNKWLDSTDEKDLTGLDVAGYASVLENLYDNGNVSAEMSPLEVEKLKMDYADKALAAGAVTEKVGSMFIDHDKVLAFEEANPNFQGSSWEDFKFNTSLQSVQEQGVPWRQELERRRQMEPEWTNWDAVALALSEKEQEG